MRVPRYLILFLLLSACSSAGDASPGITADDSISTTTVPSPEGDVAEVIHVFDGDSLVMRLDDGPEIEVRLLGINAPEGSECFGGEARDMLQSLLESGPVTLVTDSQATDQFERNLRYVYVNGTNVNLEMINSGNALALQTDHSLNGEFTDAGDGAAASLLGMWAPGVCGGETPTPPVVIVDYVFDPRGRDAEDLNGEWAAVANDGPDPVDMTGWVLRDESTQNRFGFPPGFLLGPGREVVVHSGCGVATNTDLFWCAADPVWSNGGDTVILQSSEGSVIARERYDGDF